VIDITDPINPRLVGECKTANTEPYDAWDVAVSGHYAYVVELWTGSLAVIDIGNPAQPRQVGRYQAAFPFAEGVAVSGQYAYMVGGLGVAVIDIGDPANPR
jgi:hypothetical protein